MLDPVSFSGKHRYGVALLIPIYHFTSSNDAKQLVAVNRVYSTMDFDEFMEDWGYVEEAAAAAVAFKSGLMESVDVNVNITDLGVRVKEEKFA